MTAQPIPLHANTHAPDGSDPLDLGVGGGYIHYGFNQNLTPPDVPTVDIEVTGDGSTSVSSGFGVTVDGTGPDYGRDGAIKFIMDATADGKILLQNNSNVGSGIELTNNGEVTGKSRSGILINNNASPVDGGQYGIWIANDGTSDMRLDCDGGNMILFANGEWNVEAGASIFMQADGTSPITFQSGGDTIFTVGDSFSLSSQFNIDIESVTGDVDIEAVTNINLYASGGPIFLQGTPNVEIQVLTGGYVNVKDNGGADIFKILETGALHGKTGQSLVFDL